MYFFDQLAASIRDHSLALGNMIVTTEPTARQLKTKAWLDQVYGVAKNLCFLGIISTIIVYLLLQLVGDQRALLPFLEALWMKLSFPAMAGVILLLVALFLALLRGLMFLFNFITATELTKFYLFIELINMIYQFFAEPAVRPTPFLIEMLNKILGI